MMKTIPFFALLAAIPAYTMPLQHRDILQQADSLIGRSGFANATLSLSHGGHAVCVTGDISVSATAMNENISMQEPVNQTDVTNFVVDYIQVNTSLFGQVNAGNASVSGPFNINAKLCYPLNATNTNTSTIQFLIHGIAFDKSYWDITEGYSYVDTAALAGYTTFSYDRLGTGASDRPDPIQTVQARLQVEIAHSLIQSLRNGSYGSQAYSQVIGVGHSFGSIQMQAITSGYPDDLDAAVLTGFSTDAPKALAMTYAGFNPAIASENQPNRFPNLSNGYLVTDTPISNQLTFLRAPSFDPEVFGLADNAKQTFTIGEMFTLGTVTAPAPSFTSPVFVLLGENDLIFCQSNCNLPSNQAVLTLNGLYANANNGSRTGILPGVGHGINLHYQSVQAFQQIMDFFGDNGFSGSG